MRVAFLSISLFEKDNNVVLGLEMTSNAVDNAVECSVNDSGTRLNSDNSQTSRVNIILGTISNTPFSLLVKFCDSF